MSEEPSRAASKRVVSLEADNKPEEPPSEGIFGKLPKKWRFCRRCSRVPNFFFCIKIEIAVLIAITYSFLVDSALIAIWSIHRFLWVQPDDLIYQSEVTRLNGELVVIQVFCAVSNFCLLFGSQLRFPLLCLAWVTVRLIWFYYALVAWMQALSFKQVLDSNFAEPVRFNVNGTERAFTQETRKALVTISHIILYTYWPIVLIFLWIILGLTVYIFQIMEANERRRRSTPVGVYIDPTDLKKLSELAPPISDNVEG